MITSVFNRIPNPNLKGLTKVPEPIDGVYNTCPICDSERLKYTPWFKTRERYREVLCQICSSSWLELDDHMEEPSETDIKAALSKIKELAK